MRVLILHNRYLYRGGEDVVFEEEAALLQSHGHEVESMEADNRQIANLSAARCAVRTLWSSESYRRLRLRIKAFRPAIIHVHNFFPLLSPSIFHAARIEKIPIVMTLHNYRLICLGGQLLREGRVCEDCITRHSHWPGIVHGCYRESRSASTVTGLMLAAHNRLGTWRTHVTRYIALTSFARAKMIEGGIPADNIVIKGNFLRVDPGEHDTPRNFALFVGRLSREKGVMTLLDAWERARPSIPLKIAGDGPLDGAIKARAETLPGVECLGNMPGDAIINLLKQAKFLLFPSIWYEGMPRTIIEAFACGTAVLASDLGGMREMIRHDFNGRLIAPGQAPAWAAEIDRISHDTVRGRQLGKEARRTFLQAYTPEKNYSQLMAIYQEAIASSAP